MNDHSTKFLNQQILELREQRAGLTGEVERLRNVLAEIQKPLYGLELNDTAERQAEYWCNVALSYRRMAVEALKAETPSVVPAKKEESGACSCHITGLKECPTHKEWPKKYWGESQPEVSPIAPKERVEPSTDEIADAADAYGIETQKLLKVNVGIEVPWGPIAGGFAKGAKWAIGKINRSESAQ